MCECIKNITKHIRELDPETGIEETQYYKVGKMLGIELRMCAYYKVRLRDRNNQFTKRKHKNILDFKYCPFCGEKYQ